MDTSTLLPTFPSPQKATWENTDKHRQKKLYHLSTWTTRCENRVQSVNTCFADVKNNKSLPRCLQYLRCAASSQPSYRWASKLQSPTQLMAAMPQSPVRLFRVQGGSILAFRLKLIRFVQISNSNSFNHPADCAQSQFGNIQVTLQNQLVIISFTLSTQFQQRTTVHSL